MSRGDHPVFVELRNTIEGAASIRSFFANDFRVQQDVTTKRYKTWGISSNTPQIGNPIGRLLLGVAGYRHEQLALSRTPYARVSSLILQEVETIAEGPRICRPTGLDVRRNGSSRRREAYPRVVRRGPRSTDAVSGSLEFELRATWLGGTPF